RRQGRLDQPRRGVHLGPLSPDRRAGPRKDRDMGLIDRLTSRSQQISTAAGTAARVAQALAARKAAPSRDAAEGLARIEAEFARGGYDGLVNALNRLPRPLLMLGAVAVGGYAMLDPEGFAARVEAMAGMPEPLWWLSGAMLGLHFVGRE